MAVLCKVVQCNYCSTNGFCQNSFVKITPNGLCGRIYFNNGQIKPDWNQPLEYQEKKEERIKEITDNEKLD